MTSQLYILRGKLEQAEHKVLATREYHKRFHDYLTWHDNQHLIRLELLYHEACRNLSDYEHAQEDVTP